jgi:hypothetical protein
MLPFRKVVMLPLSETVVMLPLLSVVMLPANALEVIANVSNEAQRIDWNRFIVFLLVNRAFTGVVGLNRGCSGKLPLLGPTVNK